MLLMVERAFKAVEDHDSATNSELHEALEYSRFVEGTLKENQALCEELLSRCERAEASVASEKMNETMNASDAQTREIADLKRALEAQTREIADLKRASEGALAAKDDLRYVMEDIRVEYDLNLTLTLILGMRWRRCESIIRG